MRERKANTMSTFWEGMKITAETVIQSIMRLATFTILPSAKTATP